MNCIFKIRFAIHVIDSPFYLITTFQESINNETVPFFKTLENLEMLCLSLTIPLSSFFLALKAEANERKLQMSRLFAICSTLKCTLVLLWRRSVCNFIWKLLFHKDFCLQTCFSLQKWLMPWNKSFFSLKLLFYVKWILRYMFWISITTSTSSLLQSIHTCKGVSVMVLH